MNKRYCKFLLFFSLLFSASTRLFALSYTDIENSLTTVFSGLYSPNEGETSFRSLLIPAGGRSESLGSAYTGLCDDTGYINFNAAAGSLQKQLQIAAYHNSWIADSNMETLAVTARPLKNLQNLGFGVQIGCFYVPFSEYNLFGQRVNSSYYSETTAALNVSYNFLEGYNFKGIAVGGTLKGSWRGMPNYTDSDTDSVIKLSGFSQSGLGLMADLGVMLRFNFLKFYASREPNVKIGISAQNVGLSFTGVGSGNGLQLDDPLPTFVAAGISVQFIPMFTATIDIKQPLNLQDLTSYNLFSLSTGVIFDLEEKTDIPFNLLVGVEIKGGNPRFSAGAEFGITNFRYNVNYTLDFTSSVNPINRISLSGKVLLGDNGRAEIQKKIDELYLKGLNYYYMNQWQDAIDTWQEILLLNKRYDPAILGINSARAQLDMLENVRDSMFFED